MVHTVFSAGELSQDTEGAGLGGPGPRVPVLRVLDQALLAGFAQRGGVILSFHVGFPVEPERWRSDVTGNKSLQNRFWLTNTHSTPLYCSESEVCRFMFLSDRVYSYLQHVVGAGVLQPSNETAVRKKVHNSHLNQVLSRPL